MDSPENGDVSAERFDMAASARQASPWIKITTDYHGALVRLTTARAEKKQYLLFGFVELYPRDIPVPEGFNAGEKPWSVPSFGGDVTLAFSALPMPVVDALTWYEGVAQGKANIPLSKPVELVAPRFGVEPALGRFCVGDTVPFEARWHGGPRIHRLVPMEEPAEAVQKLRSSAAAREWLADNAGFDPFEYEAWLASLSLLAPDPLFAEVRHFMLERKPNGSERVVVQAERRRYEHYPEADANALKLVLLQRRPAGWTEVLPAAFDADGFAIKEYPEPVSETGYAVSCPERGLIRMGQPSFAIEQVSVGLGVVNTVLDVEVPAGGRRKPTSRYQTNRVNEAGSVHVGEPLPPSGAIRLIELQEMRKDRVRCETAPQRLFGSIEGEKTSEMLVRMRGEAETYVASLVAWAQRRVIFVDPDFGVREFQNYALRVMRQGVTVKILTGGPNMRGSRVDDNTTDVLEQQQAAPSTALGVLLLKQVQHVQGQLGSGAPEVFVMPGSRKPVFHDRFLVIDDIVWALGPSFNELGERIGLISKVHEPRIIIAAIEQTLTRAKPLADWIVEAGLQDDDAANP